MSATVDIESARAAIKLGRVVQILADAPLDADLDACQMSLLRAIHAAAGLPIPDTLGIMRPGAEPPLARHFRSVVEQTGERRGG